MTLSQVHNITPIHGRLSAINAITPTIETISKSRIWFCFLYRTATWLTT